MFSSSTIRYSAEKLIGLGQGEFRVVTLDGHYYPARQIHTGGGDKQMPLLGRESDLTRLKAQIEDLHCCNIVDP